MFRYAFCNEMFVNWTWEHTVAFAAETGYDGIEIAPFTFAKSAGAISASQRRHIRRTAEQAGIDIVGLHWLLLTPPGLYVTTPDKALRKRTADYFVDLVRLCGDLGGSVMVIGSPKQRNIMPGVTREQAMDYAVEVYGAALPEAEKFGVTLAIEPLAPKETNFIRTGQDGMELIDRIGHDRFQLHLDVKAMSGSEVRPIPDVIHWCRRALAHFHSNDPNLLGPGMGAVDHRPIVKALAEIGYTGYLSVEVFDYRPGPERIARESMNYLKRITAEL